MSFSSSLKKAAGILEVTAEGLKQLQALTHVGGDKAAESLAAISTGLAALEAGIGGTMTVDEVRAQIPKTADMLDANNAKAHADLDEKFPNG